MKKYFYALCMLLACGSAFTACSDDDDPVIVPEQKPEPEPEPEIMTLNVTMNFTSPKDFDQYKPTVGIESLTLKEINTGVVTPVVTKETRANGSSVVVTIPEGLYTIDMEGTVNYNMNGQPTYSKLRAYKENVTITAATATAPLNIEGAIFNATEGFVIAEIFFTGTATPEGKQYTGDKYFRIYNNSSEELCADGLTIAESEFMTVKKFDYKPDIMNEAFSTNAIYRIPVGGKIMVKPGESLLICDNGIDHKPANANSFDLTKADFEWYDKSSNPNFEDIDSKVPNLEKIYCYTMTIWGPHNRGFKSYVLARLGDDAANQLTAEAYLKDYAYEFSFDMVLPNGNVVPMKPRTTYKIPNKWILDAVNLSVESDYVWNVTAPTLDKGWTYCGKIDGDKTRYGKSVRRKVLSGMTLQDTNNSSADFLPEQEADPYFKFHE